MYIYMYMYNILKLLRASRPVATIRPALSAATWGTLIMITIIMIVFLLQSYSLLQFN